MSGKVRSKTPKQPQAERRRDWYPYYAGFTEGFVEAILREHASDATRVLDPWNGSGTTTAVCARSGVQAFGLDINPVMTIMARARLTPRTIADSLDSVGREIFDLAQRLEVAPDGGDALATWIRPDGVSRFRGLQQAIHRVLARDAVMPDPGNLVDSTESLPLLACFYYTALFATARDLLSRFRSSNPTWVSTPATASNRIRPSWDALRRRFLTRVIYLQERLGCRDSGPVLGTVKTGSALSVPREDGCFDACITSPPYATRIDYVKSVLPELAVLGACAGTVSELRRSTTGSPVVRGISTSGDLRSSTAALLVERIREHSSHGSRSYYFPWISNYLVGLQRGLQEISRVVARGCPIFVVVQDSHYKEIRIDLQRIVQETLESVGREPVDREDYPVAHLMSRRNPAARRHLTSRQNTESVLEFR